jgi:RNA polymerase sigma-70 factor (ECF subfamily)
MQDEELHSHTDTAEEVRRAKRGDTTALARLVQQHVDAVYCAVRGLVGDPYLAEDIVQEALLTAWRHLPTLRNDAAFRPWLTAIAVRLAKRDMRRHHRGEVAPLVDHPPAQENDTERATTSLWVAQALATLPALHRQLMLLHYWEDMTCRDIARMVRRPPGTVRRLLAEAREMVRKWISTNG